MDVTSFKLQIPTINNDSLHHSIMHFEENHCGALDYRYKKYLEFFKNKEESKKKWENFVRVLKEHIEYTIWLPAIEKQPIFTFKDFNNIGNYNLYLSTIENKKETGIKQENFIKIHGEKAKE